MTPKRDNLAEQAGLPEEPDSTDETGPNGDRESSGSGAADAPVFSGDVPRALEAIFMVADEPQTLVSLATAVGAGAFNGTLITLHDATGSSQWTRCLSVTLLGLMSSMTAGTTVNGFTCT